MFMFNPFTLNQNPNNKIFQMQCIAATVYSVPMLMLE